MGSQRTHFANWDEELKHREARIKKIERVQALKALLAEWEPLEIDHHQYVLDLRRRLRCAETQLSAMKP